MTRRTIIFGITSWVKLVTLYLEGGGGRGIGGGVRENNASCFLLTMAHLLIGSNGGIRKGTIQPRLKKWYSFSLLRKSPKRVVCSNEMLCYAMVNDKPGGLSECSHPLPQEIW